MANGRKKCVESHEVECGLCAIHVARNYAWLLFEGMRRRFDR